MRTRDYRFSFEKMLSFKGNTASYLLYSFARINNIFRKIKDMGVDAAQTYTAEVQEKIKAEHPAEIALLLVLFKLNQVLSDTAGDLCPHHLCDWAYSLAVAFTDFYEKCRVVEGDRPDMSRLALCEATRQGLRLAFRLLGLKEVDRM